ncbi:hypothetical protein G6F62_014290 [Rhizopus arrhizus]|nr:hypothetical protein G6F62_014290 [Rhizopus arrhizus]
MRLRYTSPIPRAPDSASTEEQFIAAVTRQRHRHALPRQARDQRGRHLRGIGEGLVEHRRQLRHHRQRVGTTDVQLGVVAAQVRRQLPGQRRLVVARTGETEAEAVRRPIGRARG